MFVYCGNNPVAYCDPFGNRYCEATSVSKESAYNRFLSCQFQNFVVQEELGLIVDLTDTLNGFMQKNLETLREYKNNNGYIKTRLYFYSNVKDGGDLDIKLQDEWQFESGKKYMYNGMVLRYDDPGNINFGYLGAELFPQIVLCIGAGINQLTKPDVPHNVFSFFDDPRDTYMIKYGYGIYKGWY